MSDDRPYTVTRFYRCSETCSGHAAVFSFSTPVAARDFRVSSLSTRATWTPRGSIDVEVGDITGPGLAYEARDREAWARGMASVREALANAHGPLLRGSRVTGAPSQRRDPVPSYDEIQPDEEDVHA